MTERQTNYENKCKIQNNLHDKLKDIIEILLYIIPIKFSHLGDNLPIWSILKKKVKLNNSGSKPCINLVP